MYAGIDIGTGSLKAILGLKSGIHTITGQYLVGMVNGGYHKADLFKESVQIFFNKISDFSRKIDEKIEGISLCGHGPSIILIDDIGNPLTDIQTWQDSNAFEEADELKSTIDGFAKDGTCFEAKLYKLFKDRNNLFSDSIKALYPKDYVIYLLTGQRVIDFPTASTIAFFNSKNRLFDTYSTGIPVEVFPEIVESWQEVGSTGTGFSRKSNLGDGIPVFAGGIDAWCEALGAGAIDNGMMVDGTGTSTCITCCRDGESSKLPHVIPEKSLDIEMMSATGDSIDWLKNILTIDLEEMRKVDSFVPVPTLYLPYLNGERSPVWDERASASFTGIVSETSREDLIKSVLQGISFGTRQCIELVGKGVDYSGIGIRAVGGGANNKALLQYKSDITGVRFISMKETDAAPLGAMILASYGCGAGSIAELTERWVKINFEIIPDKTFKEIWEQLYDAYSIQYSGLKEIAYKLYKIKNELRTLR